MSPITMSKHAEIDIEVELNEVEEALVKAQGYLEKAKANKGDAKFFDLEFGVLSPVYHDFQKRLARYGVKAYHNLPPFEA